MIRWLIAASVVLAAATSPARADQLFGIPFEIPRGTGPSYQQEQFEQLRSQQQRLDEQIRREQTQRDNDAASRSYLQDNSRPGINNDYYGYHGYDNYPGPITTYDNY